MIMEEEHTLVTIRTINFSIKSVWEAWTNPDTLSKWWGPSGFTNTFHVHEFRQGGKWIYTMHGPDAGNYENDAWFTEIEEPILLQWNRNSQPRFLTTVKFEKIDAGQTRITWKMQFENKEMYLKLVKFVPEKNEENLDRLEAELQKTLQF